MVIRSKRDEDDEWVREALVRRWKSSLVVSRGHIHDALILPALIAEEDGSRVGLLTYRIEGRECEVVTIDSFKPGAGSALLTALEELAAANGCRRAWLITTNDNVHALRFYQRRGWDLVAVHRHAVTEARNLKPQIPELGRDGIPLRHELELERGIDPQTGGSSH